MESFQQKFKEEAGEYFDKLEAALLNLEKEPGSLSIVEEVFRIMHSLKGSGGMFGFDLLSDVTHDLESLYEIFRTKKIVVDSTVIDFTLGSIDQLKHILTVDPDDEKIAVAEKLKEDTRALIDSISGGGLSVSGKVNVVEEVDKADVNTYFISFLPDNDVFRNGTNPLYLIDELNVLGECTVEVNFDKIPPLEDINPTYCYVSWNVLIATSESAETLRDVFIFVEDDAVITIEKVSDGNVLEDKVFLEGFFKAKKEGLEWNQPETEIVDVEQNLDQEEDSIEKTLSEDKGESLEKPSARVFGDTELESIRVGSTKIDQYMNLVSELITAQSRLSMLADNRKDPELELVSELFFKITRQLRDNALDMSLIPLNNIAVRFKRLIRDLSKELNKEVRLETSGLETELDKNIIEGLTEPILHLIRNCLDHGIEDQGVRLDAGKDPIGTVSIEAQSIGGHVYIEIGDDGAGINSERIKEIAIANGLIQAGLTLNEHEIIDLIFEPGFTTSSVVTDVSGRGVGMDVVRKKVLDMRGTIEIKTEVGKFSKFIIKLPLSLSIIDGLLTKIDSSYYVIPSFGIRKIYNVSGESLKKKFRQIVELDGIQLPYLNLREEFMPGAEIPQKQFLVAVSFDNQLIGLVVDEVLKEYQAVIKPLGGIFKDQKIFSGASILGDGQLALVIDTNSVIQKYSELK